MENSNANETKRPQRLLKMAKLNDQDQELADDYEVKRRVKNSSTYRNSFLALNEDSSTFNGVEMFQSLQQLESQPKPSVEKILAKDSLRERFEQLESITTIEKMLMYSKFSMLCQYFKEIDGMLLYLRSSQKPPFLNTISEQLSLNSKIKVSQETIQQILEIYPTAYQVNWSTNEKLIRLDKSDLLIVSDVKSHFQLGERIQIFKKKMFEYIHKNGMQIGLAPLPVNQFQKKNNSISELDSLNKAIQDQPKRHIIQSNVSKEPTLSKVSQALIEKLRSKKKLEVQPTDHHAPKKQLIGIASLLHQYYLQRDVSNMFLQNVVKYTVESLKQFLLDEGQVKDFIEQLIKICPHWLKLVDNQSGTILRMSKEVDLPSIVRAIESV